MRGKRKDIESVVVFQADEFTKFVLLGEEVTELLHINDSELLCFCLSVKRLEKVRGQMYFTFL